MTNEQALAIGIDCTIKRSNRYYSEYGSGTAKSKAKYAELMQAVKVLEALKEVIKSQKTMF